MWRTSSLIWTCFWLPDFVIRHFAPSICGTGMEDMQPSTFMVIAHRGAGIYSPENTIAAFDRATDGSEPVEPHTLGELLRSYLSPPPNRGGTRATGASQSLRFSRKRSGRSARMRRSLRPNGLSVKRMNTLFSRRRRSVSPFLPAGLWIPFIATDSLCELPGE